MKFEKNLRFKKILLLLSLFLPLQNTKCISKKELALWTGFGLTITLPILYSVKYFWDKRKLSQRSNQQVINDSQKYLGDYQTKFKNLIDAFKALSTTTNEVEKRIHFQNFIKQAQSLSPDKFPLIQFSSTILPISDDLKLHEKWLNQRYSFLSNKNSDQTDILINTLKDLKDKINDELINLTNIYSLITTSIEYQQEKLLQQLENLVKNF